VTWIQQQSPYQAKAAEACGPHFPFRQCFKSTSNKSQNV
jgi:hypothetical protein